MPLPPNPPPDEPLIPLPPPELDETPALPRLPAETLPALRLAVLGPLLDTDDTLLPADDALTVLATDADLAVAALTCADASEADLLVAATPPPVPEACPETDEREASRAVLRDAACAEATLDGLEPLGAGGAE
jgi:hypothetical protein